MARLPFLEAEQSAQPEFVAALYERIGGWGRPVAHLYKVLANQPQALGAFLGMSHYVREKSSLSDSLREIAVLATAHALRQPYELAHHEPLALAAGVSPAALDAIATGDTEQLESVPRAVVAYATQVARGHDVEDEVFAELRRGLSDQELTDLVVTVAWYHLCAAILGPLRVELEPEYSSA